MNRLTGFMAAALTAAPLAAFAAEDPARWEQPITTAAQRLENSTKEARNAMAEALKECRASGERKACEAEARAQYQRDVAAAKSTAADGRPQKPSTP